MNDVTDNQLRNNVVEVRSVAAPKFDFEKLIKEYQTPLLRYVGHLLGRINDEAEDVVQDAFMKLHHKVVTDGLVSVANIKVWLFRVAHNKAMDVGRKRTRHKNKHEQVIQSTRERTSNNAESMDSLGDMIRQEVASKALEELDLLPEAQKRIIMLKIVNDLTQREIAEVVDMALSSVNYQLNHGLKTLAKRLKEQEMI